MKILGFEIKRQKTTGVPRMDNPPPPPTKKTVMAFGESFTGGFTIGFNGEKNLGEMGPIVRYVIDHGALTARSWQLYMDSEVCQMVFRRFAKWTVGSGLKLQSEPAEEVLKSEKIRFSPDRFKQTVESRWKIYSNSKLADYSNMRSLNKITKIALTNAIVGGDVLVVLRYEKGTVKVQLIDGAHVCTPSGYTSNGKDYINPANGNRIRNGVELDASGQHVAYYIKKSYYTPERIAARDSNGILRAYLVYGLEYRLDTARGIPLVSAVMESAKKLERYKEATLGSAEEVAKISYQIVHNQHSDGTNVLDEMSAIVNGTSDGSGLGSDVAVTQQGEQLAKNVAATTNKQAYNMPIGSEIRPLKNEGQLYFSDFFTMNIDLICATVGIPPNVAMMKYDSNFSASRAALKDWEHTLLVDRKDFGDQFLQPIYNFWLWVQILQNKISAPGYLTAQAQMNEMVIEAYQNCRFVGANVPHIDPLKEVNAERAKLGDAGKNIPLTTAEAATEALNGGDAKVNMTQFAKELSNMRNLEVEAPNDPPESDGPGSNLTDTEN